MERLKKLFEQLDGDNAALIITNRQLGAGYILDKNDNVFCRWGHLHEGIAVLETYLEAFAHGFGTLSEITNA